MGLDDTNWLRCSSLSVGEYKINVEFRRCSIDIGEISPLFIQFNRTLNYIGQRFNVKHAELFHAHQTDVTKQCIT